jgi:toxin YhaV
VNDDRSKRAYESKTDAYAVFEKMLSTGDPPNDWNELLAAVESATSRLAEIIAPATTQVGTPDPQTGAVE